MALIKAFYLSGRNEENHKELLTGYPPTWNTCGLRKINKVIGLMPHKKQMRGLQVHRIFDNRSLHCKHHTLNWIVDFIPQIFCCPHQILTNKGKISNFYFEYTKQKWHVCSFQPFVRLPTQKIYNMTDKY